MFWALNNILKGNNFPLWWHTTGISILGRVKSCMCLLEKESGKKSSQQYCLRQAISPESARRMEDMRTARKQCFCTEHSQSRPLHRPKWDILFGVWSLQSYCFLVKAEWGNAAWNSPGNSAWNCSDGVFNPTRYYFPCYFAFFPLILIVSFPSGFSDGKYGWWVSTALCLAKGLSQEKCLLAPKPSFAIVRAVVLELKFISSEHMFFFFKRGGVLYFLVI